MNEQTNSNTSDNPEIDKALKEFEVKSASTQEQQSPERTFIPQKDVEGVRFEVPSYGAMKYYKETDTPRMIKLVIKYSGGAIKEQKQAEYVLFGLVIIAMAVSFYLFFGGGSSPSQLSPEQLKLMEDSLSQPLGR